MLFILKVIAALILLAVVVIGIYILLQGKEEMFFEVTQRTKARLIKRSENKLEFEVELPMHNDGKEEGIILDAFIRVYLPQEQYADAQLRGRVNLKEAPREDDYFEAMLLGPGVKKTMVVKFELVPEHGVTLKQAVEGMWTLRCFWIAVDELRSILSKKLLLCIKMSCRLCWHNIKIQLKPPEGGFSFWNNFSFWQVFSVWIWNYKMLMNVRKSGVRICYWELTSAGHLQMPC